MQLFMITILSVILTSTVFAAPDTAAETVAAASAEVEAGTFSTSLFVHKTSWVLLCAVLVCVGVFLSRETLASKVPAFKSFMGVLAPFATTIGAVSVGVALLDFALDLLAVRPVVGNGIPQILALAGGLLLVRSSVGGAPKARAKAAALLEKHHGQLDRLEGKRQLVGVACLVGGVVHFVLPAMPLV